MKKWLRITGWDHGHSKDHQKRNREALKIHIEKGVDIMSDIDDIAGLHAYIGAAEGKADMVRRLVHENSMEMSRARRQYDEMELEMEKDWLKERKEYKQKEDKRKAELDKRKAELDKREAELDQRGRYQPRCLRRQAQLFSGGASSNAQEDEAGILQAARCRC